MLSDIEAGWARNRSHDEIAKIVENRAKQYLPLNSNTAKGVDQAAQRKKDLYSHFVLRLAFCRSYATRQTLRAARATATASWPRTRLVTDTVFFCV